MRPLLALLFASLASAQSWAPQNSNTTASFRGISAVSADVAWASGTGGTFLRTTDGGKTWVAVPSARRRATWTSATFTPSTPTQPGC